MGKLKRIIGVGAAEARKMSLEMGIARPPMEAM